MSPLIDTVLWMNKMIILLSGILDRNISIGQQKHWFKTFVLNYVGNDPQLDLVQLVNYLDVNIISGNSLSTFFDDIEGLQYATFQEKKA
jgi:hypothetical protein